MLCAVCCGLVVMYVILFSKCCKKSPALGALGEPWGALGGSGGALGGPWGALGPPWGASYSPYFSFLELPPIRSTSGTFFVDTSRVWCRDANIW